MEADWEIEIGGGAPVIEALWPGFVNLRRTPERVDEIVEAKSLPALERFLLNVNGPSSPLWTAKCDLWEPAATDLVDGEPTNAGMIANESDPPSADDCASKSPAALACYIDLLPCNGLVFVHWEDAERFCRAWVERLELFELPHSRVDLIVRQAIAGEIDGFGITAYVSSQAGASPMEAVGTGPQGLVADFLAAALDAVAASIPRIDLPETRA